MGWQVGFDSGWDRWVGYGVPALCDHPGCNEKIDRGLSYVCGGKPYGGDRGCGLYFCDRHLSITNLCFQCTHDEEPFEPKPDLDEWVQWQLTDDSWAEWRKEHGVKTADDIRKIKY